MSTRVGLTSVILIVEKVELQAMAIELLTYLRAQLINQRCRLHHGLISSQDQD